MQWGVELDSSALPRPEPYRATFPAVRVCACEGEPWGMAGSAATLACAVLDFPRSACAYADWRWCVSGQYLFWRSVAFSLALSGAAA